MSEIRIDRVKLGKVSKTPEGYLKGNAIVTRTGVFRYQNMDGTERLELRDPNDILTEQSLETLKSLPITHDHPTSLVTSENANSLIVGMTGETVKVIDGHVSVSLNITHKEAISAVKAGKQELSAGYTVDLIPEIGVYNGEPYTHRQTNAVYNHIAIVDMARAGRLARLNLDGAFIQCEEITEKKTKEVMTINKDNENTVEEIAETIAKLTTGVDVEKVIEDVKETVDEVEKDIESVESTSNTDSLKSVIEKLKAENEELKKINIDSYIIEKTKQRTALLNKASLIINTDSLLEKTEREIMEEVIKAKLNVDMDFSKNSDDYITGRFDSVIEDVQFGSIKRQMNNSDTKTQVSAPISLLELIKKQHNNKV